jgi:hypothetical protein
LATNANDVYICKAQKTSTNTNQPFIGDGYAKDKGNFAVWLSNMSSTAYCVEASFGNGGASTYKVQSPIGTYDVTQWHTYKTDIANGNLYVDNELIGTASEISDFTQSVKLVLFASWRNSSPNGYFTGRLGECIFLRNGLPLRYFVPCKRISDNVAGFYDLCGSINAATGTSFYVADAPSSISAGPLL